jgi:hypothetical protein
MAKPVNVKRQEAAERQGVYSSLTPQQKIDRLNKRGVRAAKERKRLGFPEIPEGCER